MFSYDDKNYLGLHCHFNRILYQPLLQSGCPKLPDQNEALSTGAYPWHTASLSLRSFHGFPVIRVNIISWNSIGHVEVHFAQTGLLGFSRDWVTKNETNPQSMRSTSSVWIIGTWTISWLSWFSQKLKACNTWKSLGPIMVLDCRDCFRKQSQSKKMKWK